MEKILVVIPAYNEEKNIQNVLDELKKDFNCADILVINDCSKDNTKNIVLENDVDCITTAFNLKYAMAVQTGIKYAYKKGYDYVIQFDGDGQHIAKEAKKLISKMKETDADIVIGSRYMENEFKQTFFKKIGTKMFSKLIKIFCKKEITDPLSGFQCLNKKVIEKYAKIGEYPEFPDANLIIQMLFEGYKIEEVSVKMRLREFGESMHTGFINAIRYIVIVMYTIQTILINNIKFKRRKE